MGLLDKIKDIFKSDKKEPSIINETVEVVKSVNEDVGKPTIYHQEDDENDLSFYSNLNKRPISNRVIVNPAPPTIHYNINRSEFTGYNEPPAPTLPTNIRNNISRYEENPSLYKDSIELLFLIKVDDNNFITFLDNKLITNGTVGINYFKVELINSLDNSINQKIFIITKINEVLSIYDSSLNIIDENIITKFPVKDLVYWDDRDNKKNVSFSNSINNFTLLKEPITYKGTQFVAVNKGHFTYLVNKANELKSKVYIKLITMTKHETSHLIVHYNPSNKQFRNLDNELIRIKFIDDTGEDERIVVKSSSNKNYTNYLID